MVGQTSEQLEPNGRAGIKEQPEVAASPYLLLHHDYFAKPKKTCKISAQENAPTKYSSKRKSTNACSKSQKVSTTKTKLKKIKPKTNNVASENMNNPDVVYGTYDEKNNCITIIVDDTYLNLSEASTDVVTTTDLNEDEVGIENNCLFIPSPQLSSASTEEISDSGYESHDSPRSFNENELDMWDQSLSELFPSLL